MDLDNPAPFQVGMIPYMERNLQTGRCRFVDFATVDKRNIVYEAFCNAEPADIARFCKLQCLSYKEIRSHLTVDDSDFLIGHWESPLHFDIFKEALSYFRPEIYETIDFVRARLDNGKGVFFWPSANFETNDFFPSFSQENGKVNFA